MTRDTEIEASSPSGDGYRLDPEIFLAACIVVLIGFAYIGLASKIPGALIAALIFGTLALVAGDLVFSLDFRRTKSQAPDDETRGKLEDEQARFDKLHRPLSLLAGSLAFLILFAWAVVFRFSQTPDRANWAYVAVALAIILGVVLWWLGPRIVTDVKAPHEGENAEPATDWLRFSAVILWLNVPSFIGSTASLDGSPLVWLLWFYRIAGVLALACVAELFIRSSWALISPRARILPQAPVPTIVGSVLSGNNPNVRTLFSEIQAPGIQPEGRLQWLGQFFRKSLPRVVAGLVLILWLATSLTQVGMSEQGLRERFGKFTGEVLEPGIHLGWPWPIDHVRRYPTRQLQVMEIGFTTVSTASRTNLIWTEAHGIQEDRFVTASGSEVISFDIEIYYRISDITKFAYTCRNPETLLRDLAYQAIMLRTHATSTDSLLSRDRAALADGLREDLQTGCSSEEIGIDIAQIAIIAVHPPFEVAEDYQAVVSMQVYRDTLAIQASTYREEIIPAAHADAQQMLDVASAYAAERVATATGEAAGFVSLSTAAGPQFDLYRFRRRLEALETGLEGKRLYVVSRRILESERGEDRGLWFDLR